MPNRLDPITPQSLSSRPSANEPGYWRSHRFSLIIIFSLALLGRVMAAYTFFSAHPLTWLYSHPYEMGFLANSLIHGRGYSSPFGGSTGPTAFIAPGYPTLIAGVFLLLGSYTFAAAIAIVATNILSNLLTIWLTMHVAQKMLDASSATLAGAFWAVSLPVLFLPIIFWESSISACAVIGMIALVLRVRSNPTPAAWILVGCCCGILTLINPALVLSLVAIMAWLAFQTRHTARKGPILGLLALTLVFAPWPIRNAVRFHAFIPLRSTVGFEMWMGNRPGTTGRLDESLFPMFNRDEMADYLSTGEVAYTRGKSELASQYIRQHPAIFIKVSARRIFRFWMGTGNAAASLTYPLHAALTTLLGFTGLVLLYRRRAWSFAILMTLPLLLFPVPYYITHAEFRYRLNIDPVMTILAAFAVTQFAAAWSRRTAAKASRVAEIATANIAKSPSV